MVTAKVGDRHVVEKMHEVGAEFGGEPSGHIISLRKATTGDGLRAALSVMGVMRKKNQPLSTLRDIYKELPCVRADLKVKTKPDLESIPGYLDLQQKLAQDLGSRGRLFVRFSGTEPLLRILVEGEEDKLIQEVCVQVVQFFEKLEL